MLTSRSANRACDPLYLHDGVCDEPDVSPAEKGIEQTPIVATDDSEGDEAVSDEGDVTIDDEVTEEMEAGEEMQQEDAPPEVDEEEAPPAGPQVVEFRIAAGTGGEAWNDAASMVTVKVGDTLRIINDDNVNHRLHTSGEPCAHGPNIPPGGTFDCVISAPVEPGNSPPTYDHNYGRSAAFFVRATE